MAVGTFLEGYDLTGKTIVPFCTSTDNGIDVSMDYIREVSKGATVLDGKRIHNSDLEDVSAWLYDIGMLKQTDEPEDEEGGQMETAKDAEDIEPGENEFGYVTAGTEEYRGFVIDNVFHSVSEGDIHYHVYIPESYDGSSLYALYFAIGKNDEYYGSGPTQEAYDALYELYENQGLTKEEIDDLLVLDIKEHDYFTRRNAPNEHGGGGFFAFDEEIMGWLFSQIYNAE